MPKIVSWWELTGRRVDVTSGPLSGLYGTLQDTEGEHAIIGYTDHNWDFATFRALLSDLTPKLNENEELRS